MANTGWATMDGTCRLRMRMLSGLSPLKWKYCWTEAAVMSTENQPAVAMITRSTREERDACSVEARALISEIHSHAATLAEAATKRIRPAWGGVPRAAPESAARPRRRAAGDGMTTGCTVVPRFVLHKKFDRRSSA